MKKISFRPENDGFYGVYYPFPQESSCGIILMAGDSAEDYLAAKTAKWLNAQGVNVLAMAPAKGDYSHHNYPLERFEYAIDVLKARGCGKIGIMGASTTAMLALIAASYYSEITFTAALSPSDFVMEGFYRDSSGDERPGNGESTVSFHGEPLPYLPFAYRHPVYGQKIKEEARAGKNIAASRELFDASERLYPVTEREKIKIERICGRVLLIGAEDDCLWDTCRYIRRMEKRLEETPHRAVFDFMTYEHGTHFIFPRSLIKSLVPIGVDCLVRLCFRAARDFPAECRKTREDIDIKMRAAINQWRISE